MTIDVIAEVRRLRVSPISSRTLDDLLTLARRNRALAYARYSHFPVGAALLTGDGRHFGGCSIENASFGLTVCAERIALSAAVLGGACGSRNSNSEIVLIAVAGPDGVACSPCGACRQWLRELAPEARVGYMSDGGFVWVPVQQLLPM